MKEEVDDYCADVDERTSASRVTWQDRLMIAWLRNLKRLDMAL